MGLDAASDAVFMARAPKTAKMADIGLLEPMKFR